MIKLATYNLRNLVCPGHPNLPARKAGEIRAFREVLGMLTADIVVVQEVESTQALARINERLRDPYPVCVVQPGNYWRGLHLGVLSTLPVTLESHVDEPMLDASGEPLFDYPDPDAAREERRELLKLQRDVLGIRFNLDGTAWRLYTAHLKSHATAAWRLLENDTIRLAEVRALARILAREAESRETPVVIAGDLNETAEGNGIATLCESAGLTDVVERDWVRAGLKPSWSYANYPSRARLDYILLNAAAEARYVSGSACIHGSPSGRIASDHYPVSIDIN